MALVLKGRFLNLLFWTIAALTLVVIPISNIVSGEPASQVFRSALLFFTASCLGIFLSQRFTLPKALLTALASMIIGLALAVKLEQTLLGIRLEQWSYSLILLAMILLLLACLKDQEDKADA